MGLDRLAELAQGRFGQRLDADALPPPRGPVPDWLQDALANPRVPVDRLVQDAALEEETAAEVIQPRILHVGPADKPVSEFQANDASPGRVPAPPGVGEHGADALAFYLPFHFYHHAGAWGIYLKASGLQYLAEELVGGALGDGDGLALQVAFEALIEHEQFHFACEAAAALAELAHLSPWYVSAFKSALATSLEEALCNAAAIQRVRAYKPSGLKAKLAAWMTSQPDGYGKFADYLGAAEFTRGKRDLACIQRYFEGKLDSELAESVLRVLESLGQPWPAELLWSSVAGWRAKRDVPTYVVLDRPAPWFRLARRLPKFDGIQVEVHTNDHPPPHIHVFDPPGTEVGHGYTWPELRPVWDDQPELGKKLRKRVDAYLRRHGDQVHGRLRATYGITLPAYN